VQCTTFIDGPALYFVLWALAFEEKFSTVAHNRCITIVLSLIFWKKAGSINAAQLILCVATIILTIIKKRTWMEFFVGVFDDFEN
jgi:hypothetical protein